MYEIKGFKGSRIQGVEGENKIKGLRDIGIQDRLLTSISVAYMCQQAVEKILKAIVALQGKEYFPIHNLNRLGEIASVKSDKALPKNTVILTWLWYQTGLRANPK